MRDDDCVAFLRWALSRMHLRWPGYRKVRRQVCKRVQRRIHALGITLDEYRQRLVQDDAERRRFDGYCRITISRFYRDREVWQQLENEVLPELACRAMARYRKILRMWSVGCASGEEPYTLSILWRLRLAERFPELETDILASDSDPMMLARAEQACYADGSLKGLPDAWQDAAFERRNGDYCLRRAHRAPVGLLQHDVRDPPPEGAFDLILCRNLVFTYFDADQQRQSLQHLVEAMRPGSVLILGARESLPQPPPSLKPIGKALYRCDGA